MIEIDKKHAVDRRKDLHGHLGDEQHRDTMENCRKRFGQDSISTNKCVLDSERGKYRFTTETRGGRRDRETEEKQDTKMNEKNMTAFAT